MRVSPVGQPSLYCHHLPLGSLLSAPQRAPAPHRCPSSQLQPSEHHEIASQHSDSSEQAQFRSGKAARETESRATASIRAFYVRSSKRGNHLRHAGHCAQLWDENGHPTPSASPPSRSSLSPPAAPAPHPHPDQQPRSILWVMCWTTPSSAQLTSRRRPCTAARRSRQRRWCLRHLPPV